jgi:hypothetical protein
MSNKKQTSVEWLVEKWSIQGTLYSSDINQSKETYKQEIIETSKDSYIAGYFNKQSKVGDLKNFAEEYYKETFNTKEK